MTYGLHINVKSSYKYKLGFRFCFGPYLWRVYNLKISIDQLSEKDLRNKNKGNGKEKGLEFLVRNEE